MCWDFTNNRNFQSLEVVCRGSETQIQVTENLNFISQWSKWLLIKQMQNDNSRATILD